jgi:hypothetical protein
MSHGQGNGQGDKWGKGGAGGFEEIRQLMVSMGLVWREACHCAQKATTPSKLYFIVDSACHALREYVYIILHECFSLPQVNRFIISHVSDSNHAFIVGLFAQ